MFTDGGAIVEGPKLLPWEDDIFRTPAPKEMVMHCCFYQFNALLTLNPSWDDCLRSVFPNMNPLLMRQLMSSRAEVNDVNNVDESDKTSHGNVLNYLNNHLLDKVDVAAE